MSLSLNSRPLGSHVLGKSSHDSSIEYSGVGQAINIEQGVYTSVTDEQAIHIEQRIGHAGVGQAINIEQSVRLRLSGSGRAIAIGQRVEGFTVTPNISAFEQIVVDSALLEQPDQASHANISVILTIGGQAIENDHIVGEIKIVRRELDSALMDVTLLPDPGIQDFLFYQGKPITLDIIKNGQLYRAYTGSVDIPEIELSMEAITLRCSNTRKELDNALDYSIVREIGSYTKSLFSDAEDQADELAKRLETVEGCLDYDAELTPHYTEWAPKLDADFTIDDAGIYLRNPAVVIASRGRITNRVDIDLEYQYQRLRHRERNFEFDSELTACEYAAWGLPPSVQMLRSAIESTNWAYTNLETVGLNPGGEYTCYGSTVYYSPISRSKDIQQKKDENGNVVTDADGNPQYEEVGRSSSDSTDIYATSAQWKAATRFSQNVSEKISISISAPQSIEQYGEIKTSNSFGVRSEYDDAGFSELESYKPAPSWFTQSQNGDFVYDADNEEGANSEWNRLVNGAMKLAIAKIRGSHRDNYVRIQVPLWPEIDLRHTVEATGGRIKFKGKVREVAHYIDVSEGSSYSEVEIALSRAIGTPPTSSLSVSRPVVQDASSYVGTIKLGTHTIPLNGEQDPDWSGYILKQLAPISSMAPIGLKTPVAMIIDTPGVDDASRDDKEVTSAVSDQIGIRNDLLEITFNG